MSIYLLWSKSNPIYVHSSLVPSIFNNYFPLFGTFPPTKIVPRGFLAPRWAGAPLGQWTALRHAWLVTPSIEGRPGWGMFSQEDWGNMKKTRGTHGELGKNNWTMQIEYVRWMGVFFFCWAGWDQQPCTGQVDVMIVATAFHPRKRGQERSLFLLISLCILVVYR